MKLYQKREKHQRSGLICSKLKPGSHWGFLRSRVRRYCKNVEIFMARIFLSISSGKLEIVKVLYKTRIWDKLEASDYFERKRSSESHTKLYNITKAKRALWLVNLASTICPWVYAVDVCANVYKANLLTDIVSKVMADVLLPEMRNCLHSCLKMKPSLSSYWCAVGCHEWIFARLFSVVM